MNKNLFLFLASMVAITVPVSAQKISWSGVFAPDLAEVQDVTFGKETYVAVGNDGTVLHSPTGFSWTKGKLPEGLSCDLNTVEFAFDQFWAGGRNLDSSKAVMLLSLDGISWTDISDQFSQDGSPQDVKEFLNFRTQDSETLFVSLTIADMSRKGSVFATTDGTQWFPNYRYNAPSAGNFFQDAHRLYGFEITDQWNSAYANWGELSLNNSDTSFNDIFYVPINLQIFSYGNGFYVGAGPKRILGYWNGKSLSDYSSESKFTYATSPAIADYTGVAFGSGIFAASGTNGALINSFDHGKSWSVVKNLDLGTITLAGIKFVGDKFFAFGAGRILIGLPAEQREWTEAELPSSPKSIQSLATNGKIAVAVGAKGQILYSASGSSWSKVPDMTSNNLLSVDYDATTKLFYATGASGSILTSPNGIKWTVRKSNSKGSLFGVARAKGGLYAGGPAKSFLTSSNGVNWKSNPESKLNSTYRLVGFGSGAGLIDIASSKGQVWIHNGGNSKWRSLKSPGSTGFGDAQVFNGSVYLSGLNGKIYSSPQKTVGGSWKTIETQVKNPIHGLAANARGLAAVGSEGLVYTLFKNNKWRIENIMDGAPTLRDAIYFNDLWIVAGSKDGAGFIATTDQD
jgi:hypothetical protein